MNQENPIALLESLKGAWQGTCRTWFEPDELADESAIKGTFEILPAAGFLRHHYVGSIQGKPRQGEEMIGHNRVTENFQIAWIDSFHMNYAIMFSEGPATDSGFDVFGHYDIEKETPPWGWRTQYHLAAPDELVITAYNVTPDGIEAKALETVYRR
ncbi:MAG: DUF1579 family protein [Planctomycetales bacterium]|nr:DUF1579 family protein [Planctomycetales bacterium]